MNFLITGAAGFLGSALANQLAREGHVVRGLDDLSSGENERLFEDVHFTRGDVNDRPKLWTLLQDIDCVYHLAARVRVAESLLYPREYTDVNVGGTVSLMEAMRDVGVRRVVFASSGAVYGDQEVQPLNEEANTLPSSPYAVSKLSAEYYVRTIGTLWGIETVSLRIFNAFGPNQQLPPSHPPVVPNWLRQAVRGGSLVVHADGQQTRDFVYVTDVVRSLVAAATAPNVDRAVINIGSGIETRLADLAEMILEVSHSQAELLFTPRNDPGVSRTRADISLAKKLLSFEPKVSLEEGLKRTLDEDPRFETVKANV
ncbi:MAG: NAD-dependent epimerase/dehydratase family protein [Chloroflexi bacterium]|nr:NAD-dependent epimerase/dehydratase family protein [Chloroflexota bacterium]MQC26402.1 NAD-dependent epimerase/dehydratase family protein [Chloroflexota bacterium]